MTSFLISLQNYNWLNHNGRTNKRMGPYLEIVSLQMHLMKMRLAWIRGLLIQ